MARTVRAANLEKRAARLKLEIGRRHFAAPFKAGCSVGYRRGPQSSKWVVRIPMSKGKYSIRVLGDADDFMDADGKTILDYYQASDLARVEADKVGRSPNEFFRKGGATVNDALDAYFEYQLSEGIRTRQQSLQTAKTAIRPQLGDIVISKLTTAMLRTWRDEIAVIKRNRGGDVIERNAADNDDMRKGRATAQRIFNILRAALNYAYENDLVSSDDAWRKVRPYKQIDSPRERHFSPDEAQRLVNACPPDFRRLVQAALYTGARYNELVHCTVGDYSQNLGQPQLKLSETKNGRVRHIPLTERGAAFFARAIIGKTRGQLILTHEDGRKWGRSEQARPMRKACEQAKIEPAAGFHALRHTYGSQLAMQGVPLQVIAEVLGHSDTRITEKHYAHLNESYVSKTIRENLPDLGSFSDDNVVTLDVS